MTDLIPNELCDPPSDKVLPCRDTEAVAAGVHCDHWYEDEGCHACGTKEPNLVILEAPGNTYTTKSGKVLTDADIEALADEAERGYNVEKLKDKPNRRAPVNSDTWPKLSAPMQWQATAVADVLMNKTGAYKGSADDALTDACAIILAMRFAPEGDNHHNADLCPYCSPRVVEGT